jgi:glutaminase
MATFGFGKAASIHPSCHRRELRLTDVTSLAQIPEHETDGAGHLLVMITGTATEQTVNRDDQVFKSERPTTPHASAASWVLASSAARARDSLAVAYRWQKVQSGHRFL